MQCVCVYVCVTHSPFVHKIMKSSLRVHLLRIQRLHISQPLSPHRMRVRSNTARRERGRCACMCVCHNVNFQISSWLNGMWLEKINNNNNRKIKASLSQPRAVLLYWEPGSGLWCLQNISDFSQLSKLGLGPWGDGGGGGTVGDLAGKLQLHRKLQMGFIVILKRLKKNKNNSNTACILKGSRTVKVWKHAATN